MKEKERMLTTKESKYKDSIAKLNDEEKTLFYEILSRQSTRNDLLRTGLKGSEEPPFNQTYLNDILIELKNLEKKTDEIEQQLNKVKSSHSIKGESNDPSELKKKQKQAEISRNKSRESFKDNSLSNSKNDMKKSKRISESIISKSYVKKQNNKDFLLSTNEIITSKLKQSSTDKMFKSSIKLSSKSKKLESSSFEFRSRIFNSKSMGEIKVNKGKKY